MQAVPYQPPESFSYFYGRLLREESNIILKKNGCQEGLFLLRESVTECGSYALSICSRNEIFNYRIIREDDGTVSLEYENYIGKKFVGPIELLDYHKVELAGLKAKPVLPCDRPEDTQPLLYLFINENEFIKKVNEEIIHQLDKFKKSLNPQEYKLALNDAKGRYRYKYERFALKKLHLTQIWYLRDLDRESASNILSESGLDDGKFLLRGSEESGYKISLCYKQDIYHYKIETLKYLNKESFEKTKYRIQTQNFNNDIKFDSIIQLVDYYRRRELLDTNLTIPYTPKIFPSNPIWHSVILEKKASQNINIYSSNETYANLLQLEDKKPLITQYDDEPISGIDITDFRNIPETKRFLFENKDNYIYATVNSDTIDEKDLETYDTLGSGCFGTVYRGAFKSRNGRNFQEIPVAIKKLNIETIESKKEIIKESELMKSLHSPYIIRFLGISFQSEKLVIVLELAPLGPLHKYLNKNKKMLMSKIVKICYQVAIAMEYLSSKNLVHRDLAARNVLLVSEDLAKVSDFGMSRKTNENNYYVTKTKGKWPLKWMPPDATQHGKFDEKSDVWSFGVTCWEATSYGGRPYHNIDISLLLQKLISGYRLQKPTHCPDEVYNIFYNCWSQNRDSRPRFTELVEQFNSVINELYDPNSNSNYLN